MRERDKIYDTAEGVALQQSPKARNQVEDLENQIQKLNSIIKSQESELLTLYREARERRYQ